MKKIRQLKKKLKYPFGPNILGMSRIFSTEITVSPLTGKRLEVSPIPTLNLRLGPSGTKHRRLSLTSSEIFMS